MPPNIFTIIVISVPRTIITRVRSFPLQKHQWYVFLPANGTRVRYWQRTIGKKGGVTQRFPSSEHLRDRGGHYQAFFRYVSAKEYPAVVDICLRRRLLLISCRQIIHWMNTQIQEVGNDCGLFTIATATTLCHVEDPGDLEYQQSSMQSHLQAPQGNCNEDLTSLNFPSKATRKRQKSHDHRQLIAVFCSCRLPDDSVLSLQPVVPRKLHSCTKDSYK